MIIRIALVLTLLALIVGAVLVLWSSLRTKPRKESRQEPKDRLLLPEPEAQEREQEVSEVPSAAEPAAVTEHPKPVERPEASQKPAEPVQVQQPRRSERLTATVSPQDGGTVTSLRLDKKRKAAIAAVMAYLEEEARTLPAIAHPKPQPSRWKTEGRKLLMASRQQQPKPIRRWRGL